MSLSPIARQATQSQSIPTRRVVITDPSQLPIDYSSTPGGTLYSTTPGGTKIVYERSMLMHLRNSPMSQTPPKNLAAIPEYLIKGHDFADQPKTNGHDSSSPVKKDVEDENDQFEMDM
uniref:Eukaryotic translation initiation factor 4E-binding protein 1 n=1 Tax=Graphocephala atropunctata TaxID=36148 RepID=A0A1B6KWI1_9HEMI